MIDELLARMFEHPKRSGVIVALVLLVGVAFAWWHFVWQNPQRVFEDMLARNLSTTSVTKTVHAGNATQGVDQAVRLRMGSSNATEWVVTARQNAASVTTDSIGTPSTGYVRYASISTTQKTPDNKPYSFSSVTNVWGRSDGKTDASLNTLFAQTLLDIASAPTPPIANLTADQRDKLLQFMRQEQIFAPDYSKTKTETVNGRTMYTYQVAVRMAGYVRLMQGFAHDLGLKNIDSVDPSQYATAAPLKVMMSVDPSSHQLAQVSYADTGFKQGYTDWGLQTPINIPKQTITTTELQNRLQAISTKAN